MSEILESPKSKILDFIIENPSSHLRKIKNNLGFSMGTIQYHLTMLEKEGKIKVFDLAELLSGAQEMES